MSVTLGGERRLDSELPGPRWTGRAAAVVYLTVALAACRRDAADECLAPPAGVTLEETAAQCEGEFVRGGDPRAGAAAARAHKDLGHDDEVLQWAERLRGTSTEADLLRLSRKIHWQRGEADLAVAASRRELLLRRQAGDHAHAADSCYSLFYYAWQAADHRQALDYARQSLEEAVRAGDRKLESRALQALEVVLYEVGDLERASELLDAAAVLVGPEEPAERARLLVHEGLIRLHMNHAALARDAFERALALQPSATDHTFLRSTHLNLTSTYLQLGDVERAAQHLEAAWRYADPKHRKPSALLYHQARLLQARTRFAEAAAILETALGEELDPAWTRDLEYQRGVVAERRGDVRAAEAAYGRAADIVERSRAELRLDELKSWLMDDERRPFEALFRLQARAGRAQAALDTMERAKARTFLDAFVHAASASASEAGGVAIARGAEQRLDELVNLLPPANESPVVALRPMREVLDLVAPRRLLLYFEAGDELWLVDAAGRRLHLHRLAASASAVRDLVRRFVARPDDIDTATELGTILLPSDALAATPPGATLYVGTDGSLGELPFAALRRGGRYLVEGHAVAYVPSVRVLAEIEARPRGGYGPAAVLADPRGDLPEAAMEGREVAAALAVAPAVGRAASRERLRQLSHADVLHLATHAGVGPRGAWLALADGEVTGASVVSGRIAPRLVVLASCASAARRGRGMWGSLGAAFLVAGSESVLASLWSIEDRTARQVVRRFYQQGGADEPAAALARAQRTLIAEGKAPSLWAPFVVFGSDRPAGQAD